MITGKPNDGYHTSFAASPDVHADLEERTSKWQIALVDDHPMPLEGITAVVKEEEDLEVCWVAHGPSEAISRISVIPPDLLVTDLTMPGRGGFDFLRDVQTMVPALPILVLSMHDELLYAERALHGGARGYLMKDSGPLKILEAIRVVLSGHVYVSPDVSLRLIESVAGHRTRACSSPIDELTDREFEVFRLIGQGKTTNQVAEQLHVSPKTIGVHRIHIKEKMNFKDAISLVLYAVRWAETQNKKPA